MDDELLTVHEVAAQLRCHPETVRRLLKRGELRGTRPGGTKLGWRVPAGEVARLLQEGRAQ